MNIPDAAIEAAAQAMRGIGPSYTFDSLARAAIEAAEPFLREALAQEILNNDVTGDMMGRGDAAAFIRGGTP